MTAHIGNPLGHAKMDAREIIDRLVDPDSWLTWDAPPVDPTTAKSCYGRELAAARERTGYDESILTGEGTLEGRRVALVVSEMSFLGGSIGLAAANRLVSGIERATRERLPLIALPASGGIRMQEGTVAFLQMINISVLLVRHRRSHIPYFVYLRHPTTGGVFASLGSLGHITLAEPNALIGFLGPRVSEAVQGKRLPSGVQVAENLLRVGIVDRLVQPWELRSALAQIFRVTSGDDRKVAAANLRDPDSDAPVWEAPAWDSVVCTRRVERPGTRELLRFAATDVTCLAGSGEGNTDPALLLALARFGSLRCLIVGQDRSSQPWLLGPDGLRVARRGMRLAQELGLPLVAVIDTAGSALSPEAEQGGLAGEIGRCLGELALLEVPTASILLGQGAGGTAIALLPADIMLAAEHGWLAPLAPEGASAVVHRTTSCAAEIAASQGIRSTDLQRDGIVQRIIPEHPDAAEEPEAFCLRVSRALEEAFASVQATDSAARLATRLSRYQRIRHGGLTGP